MRFHFLPLIGVLIIMLVACSAPTSQLTQIPSTPDSSPVKITLSPTEALQERIPTGTPSKAIIPPTSLSTPSNTPVTDPTRPQITATIRVQKDLKDWKELPVIPDVSDKILEIYQTGLDVGNNPKAFSKIGDCGSTPAWFLGDFDRGPEFYDLGEYTELSGVIQEFQGSYSRTSLAARSGFNASSLFSPLWSDGSSCQSNETPLACEYRVHKPMVAFIMLGANDIWHPDKFEPQMRKILEYSIENGVIPILSTKADNEEGDFSINATIAKLAWEYEVPLLNYWLAVQTLPDYGLQEDRVHLTWGRNFFDDPEAMSKAWPVRNLTALQALDAVWRKISEINN